jgi:hypothetical protein
MNREYSETEKAEFKRQYKKLCWHLNIVIIIILVPAVALLTLVASNLFPLDSFNYLIDKTSFAFDFCLVGLFSLIITCFINRCPACKKPLKNLPNRHVKFCSYCGVELL